MIAPKVVFNKKKQIVTFSIRERKDTFTHCHEGKQLLIQKTLCLCTLVFT